MKPGKDFGFAPKVFGGKLPLRWEVVEPANCPTG